MKDAKQILIDYVEGKISINDFRKEFDENNEVVLLLKRELIVPYLKGYNYNIYDYIATQLAYSKGFWDCVYIRYIIWYNVNEWLKYNKINCNPCLKYEQDYDFLLDIQPSWLDIVDDQGIFDRIIAQMPQELSKSKRIQWGKSKIKELFRYEKTYPRWVQAPEWPIVNGKPLVFSHQKSAGKDDVRTFYYFYDPDTKAETIITQMY